MTDPAAPPATVDPAPVPVARMKAIRWWGLIVLLVLAVLSLAVLPFVVEPWVLTKLRNGLAANGWELTPESDLGFSLYGATLHGDRLVLRMIKPGADGKQEQVATADRLHAEVALFASLGAGDAVIRELAIEGMTGNLRRGPDGRIATLPPPEKPADGSGVDWRGVDWVGWYEAAMEKWKQRQDQQKKQEDEAAKEPAQRETPPETARPAPQPDVEWPKATRYQPLPRGDRHIPRVVVRTLRVSGSAVKLPDESPFEVTAFTIEGHDVALRQDAGETMTLTGKVTTRGAGAIDLDLRRVADGTGHVKLAAPAVPVQALSDPAVGGDRLARYGGSGTADLTIDNAWTGWDLNGSVVARLSGLELKPTASDGDTLRIATAVNALHGKPLTWPVKLGGTLYAPSVTDTGVDELLSGSVKDAALGAAKDKAAAEATKQLDKQLEKNPQAKDAADKLKNLFSK